MVFFLAIAGVVACKLHVFLPAKADNFACQLGRICMSSACKIACQIRTMFRENYMRLKAIRVYSARGASRVDSGKFTCFYR